jgi:hypothetical protein
MWRREPEVLPLPAPPSNRCHSQRGWEPHGELVGVMRVSLSDGASELEPVHNGQGIIPLPRTGGH